MAKKEQEKKELKGFTKEEIDEMNNVFTLARYQVVTNDPNDEQSLVHLINFKNRIIKKMKSQTDE